MKPLTLNELRQAIDVIKNSKRFKDTAGVGKTIASVQRRIDFQVGELEQAQAFLLRETSEIPADPREVLTSLDYKW